MTPEQIALVTASAARLRPRLPGIADDFYGRLFAAHPQVRDLFVGDRARLRAKFADELYAIVQAIPDLPGFVGRARALGTRHAGYRVRAEHYAHVRDALLAALADGAGPQVWDEETAAAWRLAYEMVAETMMAGAAEAPRPNRGADGSE